MLNTVYRLVQPRRIEIDFTDINPCDGVLVRPEFLSVCNADQRYFQGQRDAAVLAKKLPMALIHECVGRVIYDPTGSFSVGQRVVLVPNTPTEKDDVIAENYLRSSRFRSSGFDGFMQEYVSMAPDRLVALPENIDPAVASFTEIVSVCRHAIGRFDRIAHSRRNRIGIWGDGNIGYINALFIKHMFPGTEVYVFGVVPKKLADFTFADGTFLTADIDPEMRIDHAFECVGGNSSQAAIAQIIDMINPEGTVSLLGVSEYPVPINTRMVLEKGLRFFGSSRSGSHDFADVVDLYSKEPEIVELLGALVNEVRPVANVADMTAAFEADSQKSFGKTVMQWNV